MLGRLRRSLAVATLVFLAVGWSSSTSAAMKPVGYVVLANGPFIAIQSDRSSRSLTRGSEFYQGDRLWTGPRTKAQIRFSDGAIMTLRPDTEFSVDEYEFDSDNAERNKSLFTLIKGGFRTLTGLISRLRPDGYKVKTAYAIVGVRGTTYETVIDSGLYAAAWQGTISVTNEQDELLLGFGQEYNFARVSSSASAPTGLLQAPPQFQETIDPGLQEALLDPTQTRPTTGFLQDGVDARLTSAELASLDRAGFAAVEGTTFAPLQGGANDLATSSDPILFDGSADLVLRQGSAPLVGVTTDTSLGSPVTWGQWDGTASPAVIQPDANDASVVQAVASPVFWMTMLPAVSVPGTGAVSYDTVLGFSGAGSGGSVSSLNLNATLDFSTGALNGNVLVNDGNSWDVDFSGSLLSPQFTASANSATSTFNGTAGGVTGSLTGSLTGNASGFGAQAPLGMGGVFDFEESGGNDVAGTFLARHDGRFFAGEQATLQASAQTGFAAFGGSGQAPFTGQTTDGALGSPILFDSTAGPDGTVLRQDGAPSSGVITDPTGEGFAVTFGNWDGTTNAAVLLPDADGIAQQPVSELVHWITMTPPAALPVGSVAYFGTGSTVGATGSGSGGPLVTVSRFQTDVDFSTGSLSNGRMVVANGANTWDAFFDGAVSAGSFTASLTAGSNVNGSAAVGGLQGAFTENGVGISGIGGVFDFEESGTPTNNVQGAFVAREDRRFTSGELASLDRVGIAAFGGPTARAPLSGESSDGAGGSPIIFDVGANEVLRQGAAGAVIGQANNTTLGPAFPVSWGEWNTSLGNASIQADPNTGAVTQAISDPVFWITALPGAVPATGTGTYQTVLGFQGAGEAGAVSALAVNATVDFGTAAVAGSMQVQNGSRPPSGFADQWNVNFSGNISGPSVNAAVTSGTVAVNAVVQTNVSGNLSGTLTGPPTTVVGGSGPDGMAGAFDLRQGATNFVQGTFFARQ